MKRVIIFKTVLSFLIIPFSVQLNAQTIDVRHLYQQYPTVKSSLCPACKLWVNPYFEAIGDTSAHRPVITYEYYKKSNTLGKADRTGQDAAWHAAYGQPDESHVYTAANKALKPLYDEIAKGHCQAWILNSFCDSAAILSDTYTFNAGMEHQGQNIGTEIATEEKTRNLLLKSDVQVWCGTWVNKSKKPVTYTYGKITDTVPDAYWKIIVADGVTTCYWMPNLQTETRNKLKICDYAYLENMLGFDPKNVLH